MNTPNKKAELLTKARTAKSEMRRLAPGQMPLWHEETRAIANELARCSLISCRNHKKPREYYHNRTLYVTQGDDTRISQTGEELRGFDEDVWLTLVHLARTQASGKLMVSINNSTICKLNGWEPRQRIYNEIYKSILRLSATRLAIHSRRLVKAKAYEQARRRGAPDEELVALYDELRAIEEGTVPEEPMAGVFLSMLGDKVEFTGGGAEVDDIPQGNLQWQVPLDDDMVTLFAKPYLTLLPFEIRKKLSYTARRMQSYFLGHRKPHAVYVTTLASILDLDCPLKEQKRIVGNAVKELVDAGALKAGGLDEGRGDVLVRVERTRFELSTDDAPDENATGIDTPSPKSDRH